MIHVVRTVSDLRRDALAVSVLHDLDLSPGDDGIVLDGVPDVWIDWAECERALDGARPETTTARLRLATWLLARRTLADLVPLAEGSTGRVEPAEAGLRDRIRPLAYPVGHPAHPGPRWVVERVLGDALELGFGLRGLDPSRPGAVLPVAADLLGAASLDDTGYWSAATGYLDAMGAIAASRWRRNPSQPLRPVGDSDVVTLLASPALRSALAGARDGMCVCVVPMRTRGWTELRRVDPAFAVAAVGATSDDQRGFDRPLLVTADEVGMAPDGGRPAEIALRDPEYAMPSLLRRPYR